MTQDIVCDRIVDKTRTGALIIKKKWETRKTKNGVSVRPFVCLSVGTDK